MSTLNPWLIMVLAAALGTRTMPALSQSSSDTPDAAAALRAESLMETLGRLPLPILLDMSCPGGNQAKEDRFVADLSPNAAARMPLKALLAASREIVEKDRARIENGEKKDLQRNGSSDQKDVNNLKRLTSAVFAALGPGEFLNYEKAKLHYRGDTMPDEILSAIANIAKYQIPAYNRAIENSDSAAAESIKAAFVQLRLKELNQHPEAVAKDLIVQLVQEFDVERQEWAAMQDVITVGLGDLTESAELQQKASLRKSGTEQRNEEVLRLAGKNPDPGDFKRDFSPLNVVNTLGNSRTLPLQTLEDIQQQLRDVLAREGNLSKTRSASLTPTSPAEASHAGALKTRGAISTPRLQAIYQSTEFNEAYETADLKYQQLKLDPAYTAPNWDAKKPLVWLMHTQQQMFVYSREFQALKYLLDTTTENVQTRQNTEKVAQISEIQDRLTEDNLTSLNGLIGSVDLKAFFKSNHLSDMENLWAPARQPEKKRVLDESKMGEVVKLLENVNTCLSASGKARVQFAHSASFSSNVPRDADDKPLTPQQALVFWQWYNHGSVDKAVVELYDSLHRAQRAAAEEGLLGDSGWADTASHESSR